MQPGCGPLPHELLLVPPVPVLPVGGAGPALPARHAGHDDGRDNADVRPTRLAGVGLPQRLDELHRTRGMRQKRTFASSGAMYKYTAHRLSAGP
jgi:hypothetical protein